MVDEYESSSYDDEGSEHMDESDREPANEGETLQDVQKKKERKASKPTIPKAKLDLERILGDKGFKFLLSKSENYFQFGGKGHEASDLNKIISLYQEWTHSLYPRYTFYDVVKTIEKRCHSKLAHLCMKQWYDEWKRGTKLADIPIQNLQSPDEPTETAFNDVSDLSSAQNDGVLTIEQLELIETRRRTALEKLESRSINKE